MIFAYFKHYFIFFNVNEHLEARLTLARGGSSAPSPFLLLTQYYLFDHSHNHTSLILLNAWYLRFSCILLSVCLHEWSNSDLPSSISPLGLFQGTICSIEILKDWTLDPWITKAPKLEAGPDLKRVTQTPLHTMLNQTNS